MTFLRLVENSPSLVVEDCPRPRCGTRKGHPAPRPTTGTGDREDRDAGFGRGRTRGLRPLGHGRARRSTYTTARSAGREEPRGSIGDPRTLELGEREVVGDLPPPSDEEATKSVHPRVGPLDHLPTSLALAIPLHLDPLLPSRSDGGDEPIRLNDLAHLGKVVPLGFGATTSFQGNPYLGRPKPRFQQVRTFQN